MQGSSSLWHGCLDSVCEKGHGDSVCLSGLACQLQVNLKIFSAIKQVCRDRTWGGVIGAKLNRG